MNKYEIEIKKELERHNSSMKQILSELEKDIAKLLSTRGNFKALPGDSRIRVSVIDGAGRNVRYDVCAVGTTTDGQVIYVTYEALAKEYENGYGEEDIKKSRYWWFFSDHVSSEEAEIINCANVLTEVYNILKDDED